MRATTVRLSNGEATDAAEPYLDFFLQRYADAYRLELTAFIDAIAEGRTPPTSIADAIEALRLAQEVGGAELGALLRALSRMLREDLRTRGELRARQSWTVNGARVAVRAPWLVLALLSTRPQAAQAYATTAGGLVLLVGALVSAIAYRLMLRLGRLPEEERVLR